MEGEAGHGVPEPADRGTWPATGDGGRVDQLFRAEADEGDAEQVAVVLVDDHAGVAGIAAYRPAPGTAWPGSTSITRMRYPARSAWSAVSPTAPARGSQKNTCGTAW